jgi:hypothetical protein
MTVDTIITKTLGIRHQETIEVAFTLTPLESSFGDDRKKSCASSISETSVSYSSNSK